MESLKLNDVINEIVRLKGTKKDIDTDLKYLISKFTPTSKAIDIAKNCTDGNGELILDKLPDYDQLFEPSLIQNLRKHTKWKDFQEEFDKVNSKNKVKFGETIQVMLRYKPKK